MTDVQDIGVPAVVETDPAPAAAPEVAPKSKERWRDITAEQFIALRTVLRAKGAREIALREGGWALVMDADTVLALWRVDWRSQRNLAIMARIS